METDTCVIDSIWAFPAAELALLVQSSLLRGEYG